jgi:hypothetical protein
MGCLKGGVIANKVVPTAGYVRFATHYSFRPDWWHPGLPQPRRLRKRPSPKDQECSLTELSALSVKAGQDHQGSLAWVAGYWNGAAQLGSLLTLPRSCRREAMPSLRKTFFRWYSTV